MKQTHAAFAARAALAVATLSAACIAHAGTTPTFRTDASFVGIDTYEVQGKLAAGADGAMYGTTNLASTAQYGTCGSVYRVDAAGNKTTLHLLNDFFADGCQPAGQLVPAPDGWLYGTTMGGGTYQAGVIFRVSPAGAYEVVHVFDPAHEHATGGQSGLTLGADGLFYGTGSDGQNGGSVYVFRPADGTVTPLHLFPDALGSPYPNGVVFGGDGLLYGVSFYGGSGRFGLLFSVSTSGSYKVVHEFQCATDGCEPQGRLVAGRNGAVYGTALTGGAAADGSYGAGTVFRYGRHGFQVLHVFTVGGSEGEMPGHEVTVDGAGHLYGTTEFGAAGFGTVFSLDDAGSFSLLHTFSGGADGGSPWTGPSLTPAGNLIGVTELGGAAGLGTVYEIDGIAANRRR